MSGLDRLKDAVGAQGFSEDEAELAPHLEEWRSKYKGHTPLLLKPATTAEVSAVLRICQETDTRLVTQGGNTGLVGGQIPLHGEVLLSTKRLNRIRHLDESGMTLTAEAGVTLSQVQRAAADKGLLFPLSLASEGLNYGEIAARLFVSHATVKAHLANIYAKLDARDMAAAVATALRTGQIE